MEATVVVVAAATEAEATRAALAGVAGAAATGAVFTRVAGAAVGAAEVDGEGLALRCVRFGQEVTGAGAAAYRSGSGLTLL